MHIEHIALWVRNLEAMCGFYQEYFGASLGPKYENPGKAFQSYFLNFATGARLELMHRPDIERGRQAHTFGYVHLALSVGSKDEVERLTSRLERDGYTVLSRPRMTGDGYYESVVLDPEDNRLEITV